MNFDWSAVSEGDAFALRTDLDVVIAGGITEYETPNFDEAHHRFAELDEQVHWSIDDGQITPHDPDKYEPMSGLSTTTDGGVQLLMPSPVYNNRGLLYWAVNRAGNLTAFNSGAFADPSGLIPDVDRSRTEGSA